MAELIREIVIDATPETIWPFLTEPDKHVQWIGTVAEIDPRPGGIYRVLVNGRHQSAGEFLEVVSNEKVAMTFGWDEKDHPIPPGSTKLEITLHPEGEKTRVRLVHSGLPADAVEDHGHGWTRYLDRLAVVGAGGDVEPDTGAGGMMLAHVAGVPLEEMFLPLLFGAGALYSGVSAVMSCRHRKR